MSRKNTMAILVIMGGLTALSIDIYLPAVAEIAAEFNTHPTQVAWTISAFMLSFAVGQLFYGHLSDRFGRKVTFIAGMVIYLVGNLGAAWASGIEWLIFWRFVQGFGACAGTVSCFAIARDLFSGPQLTQALSKIATAIALAPILAPMLGAKLTVWWSWRASFLFLALLSAALMIWTGLGLPETRRQVMTQFPSLSKSYGSLFKHGVFMRFTVINSFCFAALFVFISGGAPLMVGEWGLTGEQFSYLFALNAFMYMVGSFIVSRLAKRLSTERLTQWGSSLCLTGGILILALAGFENVPALLGPMFLVTFGVSFLLPSSTSGALESLGDRAGSAAALQGFLRFGCAGLVGVLHGLLPAASSLWMGIFITICALVTVVFSFVKFRVVHGSPITCT